MDCKTFFLEFGKTIGKCLKCILRQPTLKLPQKQNNLTVAVSSFKQTEILNSGHYIVPIHVYLKLSYKIESGCRGRCHKK